MGRLLAAQHIPDLSVQGRRKIAKLEATAMLIQLEPTSQPRSPHRKRSQYKQKSKLHRFPDILWYITVYYMIWCHSIVLSVSCYIHKLIPRIENKLTFVQQPGFVSNPLMLAQYPNLRANYLFLKCSLSNNPLAYVCINHLYIQTDINFKLTSWYVCTDC